jgi:hypothetical protein
MLESGTTGLLDFDREGATFQVTFPAQVFGDDESLRDGRRDTRPPAPQCLRAELAKRPMVEAHDLIRRRPTGAERPERFDVAGVWHGRLLDHAGLRA